MEENDFVPNRWNELKQHEKSSWNDGAEVHDNPNFVDVTRPVRRAFAGGSAELVHRMPTAEDVIEVHIRCSGKQEAEKRS